MSRNDGKTETDTAATTATTTVCPDPFLFF